MTEETLEFERLYQIELDKLYGEWGYEINRIQGKENECYDIILTKNGRKIEVEEKGLQYYHPDCPIELIQDILPFSCGWFYKTKATYIIFFYYVKKTPYILYRLSLSKLKKRLIEFCKEKKAWPRLSIINYGTTINLCIPWDYLIEEKIAKIMKEWDKPIPQQELFHEELKKALNYPIKE